MRKKIKDLEIKSINKLKSKKEIEKKKKFKIRKKKKNIWKWII